jgi:hypothetical protein
VESPVWSRRSNRFKTSLNEGLPALAIWLTVPWPFSG